MKTYLLPLISLISISSQASALICKNNSLPSPQITIETISQNKVIVKVEEISDHKKQTTVFNLCSEVDQMNSMTSTSLISCKNENIIFTGVIIREWSGQNTELSEKTLESTQLQSFFSHSSDSRILNAYPLLKCEDTF